MSWGATAFTPMISYNTPPFGFAERIQPSDFATCPENPWVAAENLKQDMQSYFDKNDKNAYSNSQVENFANLGMIGPSIAQLPAVMKMFFFLAVVMCVLAYFA